MDTKVFAVRIGDKYGQDVEDYINSKIPNVTWIRDELDGVRLQWNKLRAMNLDIDEPVVVIDIDMDFINDYMEAINYPIERGEFLAGHSWWKDSIRGEFELNGGFQKYYPKDCKYIYEKFMIDKYYWQEYYIRKGVTTGPVNGEQFFVEESVKEKLKLKFLPDAWMVKWQKNPTREWYISANEHYPGNYLQLDGVFNPNIKIVHYMYE